MTDLVVHRLIGERGLRLVGELDMQSVGVVRKALAGMPGTGQATLDVSDLTFIDSSGLHAIMEFARADSGNGPLIVQGVSSTMIRLFEITNIADDPSIEVRVGAGVE